MGRPSVNSLTSISSESHEAGEQTAPWGDPKCAVWRRPQLWIRTASGPSTGFGHLERSLILARLLDDLVAPVFLLDADDIWSRPRVLEENFGFRHFSPKEHLRSEELPVGLLVDTREQEGLDWLVPRVQQRGVKVVSIHDLGLCPLASDIIVDGSIAPSPESFPPGTARFYTGPSYMVLDPDCASYHGRFKETPAKASKVLLSLGGGDCRDIFLKVLDGLTCTGMDMAVTGIPGFTSWGQEDVLRENWKALDFSWASRNCSTAAQMFEADMAITAGGITAFEALSVGAPLCALSIDRYQEVTVQKLSMSGCCMNLGRAEDLVPSLVASLVRGLAENQEVRRRLSARGKRVVDGRGAERVSSIVRDAIFGSREVVC